MTINITQEEKSYRAYKNNQKGLELILEDEHERHTINYYGCCANGKVSGCLIY